MWIAVLVWVVTWMSLGLAAHFLGLRVIDDLEAPLPMAERPSWQIGLKPRRGLGFSQFRLHARMYPSRGMTRLWYLICGVMHLVVSLGGIGALVYFNRR